MHCELCDADVDECCFIWEWADSGMLILICQDCFAYLIQP